MAALARLVEVDLDGVATLRDWNAKGDLAYEYQHRLLVGETRAGGPIDGTSLQRRLDALHRVDRLTLENGSAPIHQVDLGHDDASRLHTVGHAGHTVTHARTPADAPPIPGLDFGYGFDDIGNRLHTTTNGRVAAYAHNDANELVTRVIPRALDARGEAHPAATVTVDGLPAVRLGEYFHRAADFSGEGDGPVVVEATVTATLPDGGFDDTPRIADETLKAFLPQTPELYTHDEEGNLLSDGRWNYTWDANNRLAAMETRPAAWQAGVPRRQLKFSYDYMGRRFQKQVYHWNESTHGFSLHETILFHYDGWLLVREDILPADGPATSRSHVWGNDLSGTPQGAGGVGGLLMTILEDGSVHLPVMDGNGNIVAYLNANDGIPSAEYEYGPFGELLQATGPLQDQFPHRFSTKYQDLETGFLYYGHRYYNPETGRWLNRDPIGERGGVNLYGFVGNDPVNYVDFLGLDAIRTSADGGVWWVVDGTDREVYLGVANVEPRFFGLMTSVSDNVQLNPAFGGGTVSRNHLNKLAAGQFFGHTWLFGQKYPTSASSQDRQIRNIIDVRLNPRGETRIGADTRMCAEEHAFRSNRALATSGLLLGSSLSGYTDEGAQIAEFNANLYARSMLPSVVGTHAAQVFYAAESGYILGNPDSSGLDKGLAAFDLGLMFITLPKYSQNKAYRAVDPKYAQSTVDNGFYRSGAAGRLGNDGIYANSTVNGAIAEFQYHNPGVMPVVFEVNYSAGSTLNVSPPIGNFYISSPLPFTQGANVLRAPSLRMPGTINYLIRDGAVPGRIMP